jgi:hypothetical protein
MRMLVLLFATAAFLTARGEPLPAIKVGSSDRTIEIYLDPWYSGFVSTSIAFLTGKVVETSSEVQTSPRETWLSESCVIQVERAFGRFKELEGISKARLRAGYPHSPYEPADPQWGRLRHLQKGRRILVLLHEDEGGELAVGFEAVIEFSSEIEDLPRILRRTGFNPAHFTDSDLAVIKLASQIFHDQLVAGAEIRRDIGQDDAAWLNRLVFGCITSFLLPLLVIDLVRRRVSSLVTRSTH